MMVFIKNRVDNREFNVDKDDKYLELARLFIRKEKYREANGPVILIKYIKRKHYCFIGFKNTSGKIKKILGIK
ncbi:MAG: hypothetical protein EAX96_19510 [Candidatus Lokiarchaeota archaeon]|nr:hypothetical protein [Candidatus Lokiarchaeota archaeon]